MSEDARPPYVTFEKRPVEDREASIEAGHYVAKDVVFVLVTPAGTKDIIEKEVEAWFAGLEEGAKQERIPSMWPSLYRQAYKNWLENQEDPEFGTSIKTWPALSPAQVANVLNANIRTVEDLAEATEEALARIGMGALALKSKAQSWLEASDTKGKPAAKMNALEKRIESLEQSLISKDEQIAQLEAKLAEKAKEEA